MFLRRHCGTWEDPERTRKSVRASNGETKQSGLTVNPDKYEDDIDKMTFMGHVTSKEGISLSHDKISVITNARELKTVSEVRSFLGLANFCSGFLPDLVATVPTAEENGSCSSG
jgi:hypothetical protein